MCVCMLLMTIKDNNLKGIPVAAMERLLRKAGADRVSDGAKLAMKNALESYAQRIGEGAVEYAMHAGRKTVKAEDVELSKKINN